jgi:NhaP-type Na+/H+ or K+/H+ antiporter
MTHGIDVLAADDLATDDHYYYADDHNATHVAHVTHERDEPEVAFAFLFLAITVGVFVSYLISRYWPDFPYTVILFAIGIILSFFKEYSTVNNIFIQTFDIWDSMDPHFLLYAFLPALLFGESMSLNYHHIKAALYPSLVLAGPGSLFGTLGVGCVAKYVLPYNWDWGLCLIFGSILCATDPVGT